MFWGLIMEPKRRYSQVVKKRFHVSMASLDIFSADDSPAQLLLYFQERNYLLCTLQKGQMLQCPLDLNFDEGDKVVFASNGEGNIHLSGYLIDDEDLDLEELEDASFQETSMPEKSKKRKDQSATELSPKKKSKTAQLLDEVDNYDSSDDMNFSDLMKMGEDSDEEDSDEVEEEEVDDEEASDEEEEQEDEDEDEEADSSAAEEIPIAKPKVNGVPLKQQKNAKQQRKQKAEELKTQQQQKKSPKVEQTKQTPKANKQQNEKQNAKGKDNAATTPVAEKKKQIEGGVLIEDLREGSGPAAKTGKMVQVHYEGRFKNTNKVFDSSKGSGSAFKFRLGRNEVIKGWDVGLAGMKVGGKRRITCPPAMAYGHKGSPPTIPPNATLVFDVELKNVH